MIGRFEDGDRGGSWRVDGIEFVTGFGVPSRPGRFVIQKSESLIALYERLCPEFVGGRVVELGIASGGSTALLALLTRPERLAALELRTQPQDALAGFIAERGLSDSIRPHYGVNQSDRDQLRAIIDAEFEGKSLDLVVDDASHIYEPTRASFEVLFPRLRPGGLFVIEDWAAQYLVAEHIAEAARDRSSPAYEELRAKYEETVRDGAAPHPPLARLAIELSLATVATPDAIASVEVNHHWITVARGSADLDDQSFSVSGLYDDYFRWFTEEAGAGGRLWYSRLWDRLDARP